MKKLTYHLWVNIIPTICALAGLVLAMAWVDTLCKKPLSSSSVVVLAGRP